MYGLNLSTYDIRYVRDNLLPISNNIYNLGSSTYRFANAHINDTLVLYNVNAKIQQGTSDGADNGCIALCGGGGNTVARGALVYPCGNEYSGSNGVLFLYSGNASSAYVEIAATSATSPTIRFTLTSTEQWRMSSSALIGMASASNSIQRTNDSGFLSIGGGSTAGAPSTGAYITLRGTSASSAGIAIFSSGTTTGCYCSYAAEGSGGSHRFSIAAVEQWRMAGSAITAYASSTLQQLNRVDNTGGYAICGGTSTSTTNGAVIEVYGTSHAGAGSIFFYTANNSSGHIYYQCTHASGLHRFSIGGSEKVRFGASGAIFYNGTGMGVYRDVNTGYTFLAGGTANATSEGAYLAAYGNSHASLAGRMYLYSGTASGLMIFQMGLSTGSFAFKDDVGTNLTSFSKTQCYLNVATGGDFSFRINNSQIMVLDAGGLTLPSLADGSATNSKLYYSTTQNKPCYKDSSGVVNTLY